MTGTPPSDAIAIRLDALETDLRHQLGEHAVVERKVIADGRITVVSIEPRRPDALAVCWMDMGPDDLMLQAGHEGGHWELNRTDSDVDWIEDVTRSVIAGRAVETFAPRRSHVEITLANGQVESETGLHGLLTLITPLPGWKRFGRRVRYAPYL